MAISGERINARGADISEVVANARVSLRSVHVSDAEKVAAATLLVMLDVRSLLDRVDSGVRGDGK
jgi:hypothetical protein